MILRILFSTVILLAIYDSAVAERYSESWNYVPAGNREIINGKEYLFSSYTVTGTLKEAHDYCESQGMFVVAFDTAFEFESVQQRIKQNYSSITTFWTSGRRRADSDVWFWSSTKRIFNSNYLYWRPNDQPDQPLDKEACIYINEPDYLWFDEPMSYCEWSARFNFICEALDLS